jgi:hypothetical protein
MLYATMGKFSHFASERTMEAAEKLMNKIVETYYAPKFDLRTRPDINDFAARCGAELRGSGCPNTYVVPPRS